MFGNPIIMETYFPKTQKSLVLGVWTAPGVPETTPKGGALGAPPFEVVSGAPGAVQTSKIYDFWVQEKWVFIIILIRSWGYPHPPLGRSLAGGGGTNPKLRSF